MIVKEILQRSASWLGEKGIDSPRLEAELLLAHVLEADRLALYTGADRPLVEGEMDAYRELLKRRAGGEPVAYLTGRKEFYSLELEVTPDVLVPRPETELLVDRVRELRPRRLLDVGTGSGCIAIACRKKLPEASVTATDVSEAALGVARRNAERRGVEIRFLQGDIFDPLAEDERFDVIVSNPPYVADGDAAAVGAHEPHAALYAGPRGLDVIARLVAGAPERLDGTLLVEIGEDQGDAVRELAARSFRHVEILADLGGLPRILQASN